MLITILCLSTWDVREEYLTAVFLWTLSYMKKTRKKTVFHILYWRWSFSFKRESRESFFPGQHPKGSGEQMFQCRICSARRVVENVFGLVSSVFWVLWKFVLLEPEKTQLVINIACLHNLLRRSLDLAAICTLPGTFDYEENSWLIEGGWRVLSFLFPRKIAHKPLLKAQEIREELAAYFLSGGRVERQNDCT
jgi:hypothetical protein